jgi:hypothetical protein
MPPFWCKILEINIWIRPLSFKGFLVAKFWCGIFRRLQPGYCQSLADDDANGERPVDNLDIRKPKPEMPLGSGLAPSVTARLEVAPKKSIDLTGSKQAAVFGFVRFSALTGQKCFT